MKKTLLCLLFVLPLAHAERADQFKETVIKSQRSSGDMVKKVAILTGKVEIRRGTLLIEAEHAVVTEDAQGYQHVVMNTQPGEPAVRFRQKRDGEGNLWMEGEALQVNYDDKTEVVDLIEQAKVKRTTDGHLTDETRGEHIVYSARTEEYQVSELPGNGADSDRRGVIIFQPARTDPLMSAAVVPSR